MGARMPFEIRKKKIYQKARKTQTPEEKFFLGNFEILNFAKGKARILGMSRFKKFIFSQISCFFFRKSN